MTATATPASGPKEPRKRGRRLGGSDQREYTGDEMTLVEHLDELRSRLYKSAIAVAIAFAIGFSLNEFVLDIVKEPYCSLPAELRVGGAAIDADRCVLIIDDVLGAFVLRLKAALMVTVVLAGPVVAFQVWRFVTPGLRPIERRYAIPFLVLSQLLFATGAAFSYWVLPRGLEFLLNFAGDDVVSLMNANKYLSFLLNTLLAFGISFEFPLVLAVLVLMGVVSRDWLRKHRRHALFVAFVASAIITPTQDPLTMIVLALPLAVFYEIVIIFSRVVERRRAARDAQLAAEEA